MPEPDPQPVLPAALPLWLIAALRLALRALPQNWPQVVASLITAALIALLSRLGLNPPPPPEPIPPIWLQPADGWQPDPDAVQAVLDEIPVARFKDTPAGRSDDPLPQHVYLWDAVRKVTGALPPGKNQGQVGSCVSFGTNNAVYRTAAVAIVTGANFELKDIAEEVTYAGSRVQVGKGKVSGDGSVGAWAAQFVQKWGIVPREKIGAHDLTTYDQARCRSWGRSGVPEELQTAAKQHPVQDITQVKTWAEAKRCLANGYGIAVCSGVGFEGKRDSNGVKAARGSWAHCMCLDGYHIEDGKEYGHIENSWGLRPEEGPVGWGNPSTAGFWVSSTTIAKMLNENDSWAFSNVKGFPARKLDWFVQLKDNRPLPNRGPYHAAFSRN